MGSPQLKPVITGLARPNKANLMCALVGLLALLGMASSADARKQPVPPPPMPAGYDDPGPEPQNPLPGIIEKLRHVLVDPGSLRDVTMCAPRTVPEFPVGSMWSPAEWIMQLALNSKNSFGGYTGAAEYTAYIRNGIVTEVSETPPIELLVPAVKASYVKSAADCPRVPNAEIRQLVVQ